MTCKCSWGLILAYYLPYYSTKRKFDWVNICTCNRSTTLAPWGCDKEVSTVDLWVLSASDMSQTKARSLMNAQVWTHTHTHTNRGQRVASVKKYSPCCIHKTLGAVYKYPTMYGWTFSSLGKGMSSIKPLSAANCRAASNDYIFQLRPHHQSKNSKILKLRWSW